MNTTTNTTQENGNETRNAKRPAATYYHANAKGTGSALRLELHPARPDCEGAILATLAPQKSVGHFAAFDWANAIKAKLMRDDLCHVLGVLRGLDESICDGKGLFHCSPLHATNIRLMRKFDPMPGYLLELTQRDRKTDAEAHFSITLGTTEALGLSEAIGASMLYVAFGDPMTL